MSPELRDLCELAGVVTGYRDQTGHWREISAETARALLAAMGHAVASDAEIAQTAAGERARRRARRIPDYVVVEAGRAAAIGVGGGGADWLLTPEVGEAITGRATDEVSLPPLPVGIHRLGVGDETCWILSAPPRLPLPDPAWGVTLPFYGLRTRETGGLADYRDLAEAARAVAAQGGHFVGINPIHAGFFPDPREISPYAPSHRRRFNAAHIRAEGEAAAPLSVHVDYTSSYAARIAALEAAFATGAPDPAFDAFLTAEGEPLARFALHQALSEAHGPFWRDWPEAVRSPESAAAIAFAKSHRDRVRFHAWLQYLATRQLAEVSAAGAEMTFGLYLDLAVGTHPYGAETWLEPEVFARGVSLGAPPDAFAKDGQIWGLAPMNPDALIRAGFRPFAETLRQQLKFARLLRIDHILGFDRAFWVPEAEGVAGSYVRMPKDALLAVTRIEAARAGATIVGEDLGNVPEGLQADLDSSGLLGCRVVMFELDHGGRLRLPQEYPEATLASFGTHDLPTWAGWREGRDIGARMSLGSMSDEAAGAAQDARQRDVARFDMAAGDGGSPEVVERFLAATSSRLVALQIEDILEIKDQPNLPGTINEYPNWRLRLPVGPGELRTDPRLARAARIMAEAGRQGE